MPSGNKRSLVAVATPEVGGTSLRRHLLEAEAERLMLILRRVQRRLLHWVRVMPNERAAVRRTEDGWEPILDKDGNQIMMPLIPDHEFVQSADWCTRTMLGLLKEQRERAKFAVGTKGALPIDDETLEAELAELARTHVLELSDAELAKLIAERAIEVPSTPVATSDDDEI